LPAVIHKISNFSGLTKSAHLYTSSTVDLHNEVNKQAMMIKSTKASYKFRRRSHNTLVKRIDQSN